MCTAATQLCRIYMSPCINTIRGAPIEPIRVVVVHVAARVDIPRVVRVAAIRRPQPDVLRTIQPTSHVSLFLIAFLIGGSPIS